ncbi:MAG: hypothetical protein ACC631_10650, partial [Halocynthiibacter sp.]
MSNATNILFIGVDGGGTHCRAALCGADLRPITIAEGSAANVFTNFDGAIKSALSVISEVRRAADDTPQIYVHLGLAGI